MPDNLCDNEIHVHTDVYILTHVVRNFLSNSRKYCSSGYVELEFCDASADRLVMRVRDTGCGIPKEIRDKLFATEVVRFFLNKPVDPSRRRQETIGVPVSGCRRLRCSVVRRAEATPSSSERKPLPSLVLQSAVGSPSSSSLSEEASLLPTRNTTPTQTSRRTMPRSNYSLFLLPRRPTTRRRAVSPRRRTSSLLSSTTVSIRLSSSHGDTRAAGAINRHCMIRLLKKVQESMDAIGWSFIEFETVESSQPHLVEVRSDTKTIVTLDESASRLYSPSSQRLFGTQIFNPAAA